MRKVVQNGLLLVVSIVIGLGVAELVTRWVDGLPLTAFNLPPSSGGMGLDTTAQHLDEIPRAAGMEREWFFEDPPPLPNRHTVPDDWIELDREMRRRSTLYGSDFKPWDLFKAWNAALVGNPCESDFFAGAPGWMLVYDPPDRKKRPTFRYLQNATTPLGLATNELGWRGPPVQFKRREKTIRIVFVGASTTAGPHSASYSYPEFIGHWLDRWAAARRLDIRFEVMNAARESGTSSDIEAIVRQEVSPARPDLVVYYEGANQFDLKTIVKKMPVATPPNLGLASEDHLARQLRDAAQHLALARRMQALIAVVELPAGGREWPKPDYEVSWPSGLDERDPDLARSDLPANLSTILQDLDRMRATLAEVDGELALSSFVWLVKDGMLLDSVRGRVIWEYLNIYRFPFRYRDIERLAAFQNRVFAKYAATHGLPFVDLARRMPFDANLFFDAVHTTYPGIRLKAWVVLQQLVPIIEQRLASGTWPKPVPDMSDTHPAFRTKPRRIPVDCPPARKGATADPGAGR